MKKKRFLAILLTLGLLIGMLPASLLAATTEDDGVSTAATETVSVTVGSSTTITVSGSYSESDITGYDTGIVGISTETTTTVSAGSKLESLSDSNSFYIYYTENGTTYYLVLSVSDGMGGNSDVTVSTTTDISEATLITYTSANSGSGGYLSFASGNTTYYLGVSSSSGGRQSGSSVSLTASTSASTTWSYSSNTGFSTSVATGGEDGQGEMGGGGGSQTTYYLSGTGLSSSGNTYDYAISYTSTTTTTITITGVSAGMTSFTLGETTYSITVTESSSSSFELDISAYLSTGVVYWDMDDENNDKYDTSDSQTEAGANKYVTSVTLGTSTTTDEETNESSTTANTVPWADSTTVPTSTNNYNWSTSGLELSSVYSAGSGTADDDGATLTITPAEGYYVTNVVIVCAAYAPTSEGGGTSQTYARVSPYSCSTYKNDHAFTDAFEMSEATSDGSGIAVSTDVENLYFAHSGFETEGFTNTTNVDAVYFILVEVAEIPTPAYVEYDFGEIVNYITNELGDDEDYYGAFSTASGWTDAVTDENGDTKNVYKPSDSSSDGGVLTDDTQFKYTYSSFSSENSSSWKHYANSISDEAIEEAAAAGYVFAGWAVTWYQKGEITSNSSDNSESASDDSDSYNNYSISFSDYYNVGMVGEGDQVYIAGHVRLVAQWIKIDSSQVIDYGLPVSVDVETALLDDADFEAITSNVTSRTSVTQEYDNVTTTDLSGYISADVEIGTDDEDENGSGDSAGEIEGEYGTITIEEGSEDDSGDNDSSTDEGTTETSETSDNSNESGVTYTLEREMTGVDEFNYTVTLRYNSTTIMSGQAGSLYIIPATSMYYEESFGVTYASGTMSNVNYNDTVKSDAGGTSGSTSSGDTDSRTGLIDYYWGGAFWVLSAGEGVSTSTVNTTAQETGIVGTEDDSTYGADDYYLSSSNLGDSDGSSMYVDTSSYAASFTYTFTGTGTAIYTRTLDDSGDQEGAYIRVIIWEGDEEGTIPTASDDDTETTISEGEEDENGITAVGTWFIDTRIVDNVSGSSTLYNIPVFSYSELDYGTYTVSVLVYKEGAPVQATYTIDGETDDDGNVTLTQAYSGTTTTTDEETNKETISYNYLYYVYSDQAKLEQLYYQLDKDTGEVDYDTIGETKTDYPVYYTSTSENEESYTVTSTTESEDGTTSETTTTYYLRALYFLADDTAGGDFYLDGIRIYNPLGTEDNNISSDNSDGEDSTNGTGEGTEAAEEENSENGEPTETSSSGLTSWDIASAAYEEDDEANNVVINIAQKLAADAAEGYTGSDSFVTLTDYYGDISGYDPDDTADYPDNEIYLDGTQSSEDENEDEGSEAEDTESEEDSTTYSVSFYLAVDSSTDDLSNYDIYLGLKAPDGTAGSVKINGTKVDVNSSADCYYLLDDYLKDTTVSTILVTNKDETTSTLYGYKVTITGDSGLIALTYIKVTGSDEFDIAYSSDVDAGNDYSEGEGDGSTDGGTDGGSDSSGTETTAVSTLYLLSAASVEAEDNEATDEDMLDDDSMAVDPDSSDSDSDTDSKSDNTGDEDEDSLFEPETFTASITYLKLLRCASITVKTSTDVSYITVDGEKVTGRSSGLGKTLTFSYTASKVSSGTEFEIIAYDSNGTASEPITLTAK